MRRSVARHRKRLIRGTQYRVIRLAKQIPGLKKYDISTVESERPPGPSGIHLVAKLYFWLARCHQSRLGIAPGGQPPAILPTLRTGARSSSFRYKGCLNAGVLNTRASDDVGWHPGRRTPATARSKRIACEAGQIAAMRSICALRRRTC